MDRNRIVGAIRFPTFLVVWSLGFLLVIGEFDSADASSARIGGFTNTPLTAPARIDDSDALSRDMSNALRRSEVYSGEWLPDDDREKVATATAPAAEKATGQVALLEREEQVSAPSSESGESRVPVLPVNRIIRMTSGLDKPEVVKEQSGVESEGEFAKSAAESRVRKTRPVVNLALGRKKQNARRKILEGQILEAFQLLRDSVEQGRNDPEYLGLLAVSALRSGNPAEASVVYERLLEMQPESERWWAGLALATERQGMDATPVFQRMLALSDENTELKRLVRQKIGAFG